MKSFLDLEEQKKNDKGAVVVTFGRFNPPTTGHELLIKKIESVAKKNRADFVIVPSHSQNPKKDPLPQNIKVKYMQQMFPKFKRNIRTDLGRQIYEIAKSLSKIGYSKLIVVVGSDRMAEFEKLKLYDKSYTDKSGKKPEYDFYNGIEIVQAGGQRTAGSGVAGMSASKMRGFAASGDKETFMDNLPNGFKQGEKLYNDLRKYMNISEDNIRELYYNDHIFNIGDIVENKDGRSGKIIKKGPNYVLVSALSDSISDLNERYNFWIDDIIVEKEDPDIKDRKGTQPAKYYAKDAEGDKMSKSTKQARARHFEKGTKKSDDDSSAYKPAPGDKSAKTKPSKHTNQMKKKFPKLYEGMDCPPATQDVAMNTKNRNSTIENHMYGPLNVDEPADYWKKIADKWDTSEKAAKKSLCGNCVAFDISPRMEECMPGKVSDKDGRLGYCWMHHFKCHSARTCDTWAKGGPITDNKISQGWQERSNISEGVADKSLKKKSEASGMPFGILKQVYNRGVAAWRTGHRPGTTPEQWGHARVNSFVTKSKGTWGKADADLAKKVRGESYEIGTDEYAKHTHDVTPGQTFKRFKEFKESFEPFFELSEGTKHHLKNNIPFHENIYRPYSIKFYETFCEARELYEQGLLENVSELDKELFKTDLGLFAIYENKKVPLDIPLVEEDDDVELNKPKRGGPKKFYVYVKDPSTGNIKKVSWGDTTGLKVKIDDPEARKSFAARHKCETQKDKTKPAYWACNTPRYGKQLGLKGGGNFFW